MRTGNEPLEARSALRTRRVLALWGLLWTAAGTAAFIAVGRPGWAAACAVAAVVAATDLLIVRRHIREGPHYQPGKDVPPYEPVSSRNDQGGRIRNARLRDSRRPDGGQGQGSRPAGG